MTVRIAINGFGRIGRNVVRACMNPDVGRKLPWWPSTSWRMPQAWRIC